MITLKNPDFLILELILSEVEGIHGIYSQLLGAIKNSHHVIIVPVADQKAIEFAMEDFYLNSEKRNLMGAGNRNQMIESSERSYVHHQILKEYNYHLNNIEL